MRHPKRVAVIHHSGYSCYGWTDRFITSFGRTIFRFRVSQLFCEAQTHLLVYINQDCKYHIMSLLWTTFVHESATSIKVNFPSCKWFPSIDWLSSRQAETYAIEIRESHHRHWHVRLITPSGYFCCCLCCYRTRTRFLASSDVLRTLWQASRLVLHFVGGKLG